MVKGDQVVEPIREGFSLLSHQRRLDQRNAVSLFSLLSSFSINLLVVYRESVNLIGYITRIDYLPVVYGKIVARVIVYVTLFQT